MPFVRWFGAECDYLAMVIDLLGRKKNLTFSIHLLIYLLASLEDLFNFCNRKFTLKTVLLLADQMVTKTINSKHIDLYMLNIAISY